MASSRVSQMEALKNLLSSGNSFTLAELIKGIGLSVGRDPTTGSVNVLLSHLRTKFNYTIKLTRGTEGAPSTYQLKGTVGRKRAGKAA